MNNPHSTAAPVQKIFNKGEFLFEEGHDGKEMYLIVEGKVGVFKNSARGKTGIAVIGAGGSVGEQALFGNQIATATAMALEPVRALLINQKIFQSVMETVPSWLFSMIKAIVGRMRDVRKRVDETAVRDPERALVSLIGLLLPRNGTAPRGRCAINEARVIGDAVTVFGLEEKTVRELLAGLALRGICNRDEQSPPRIVVNDPDILHLYNEYLVLAGRQETFREAGIPPELIAVLSNIAYVAQKSGYETEEGTALNKSALVEDLADHFDAALLEKNLSELCRRTCISLMPSEHDTIIYFKKKQLSRIKKIQEWLPKFQMGRGGQA